MNLVRIISIAAIVSTFGLVVSAQEADEPTPEMRAVDYRQEVMHVISAQRRVMRDMAEGKRETNVETFTTAANALAAVAKTIPEAFAMNAIVEGSTAKPEIWKNWDDFITKANNLSAIGARMAKLAATDIEAAKGMAADIKECGGCHDNYRIEEE